MAEEAQQLGLDLDLAKASNLDLSEPNPKNAQIGSQLFINKRNLNQLNDLVNDFHKSVVYLWCNKNYRPKNLQVTETKIKEHSQQVSTKQFLNSGQK